MHSDAIIGRCLLVLLAIVLLYYSIWVFATVRNFVVGFISRILSCVREFTFLEAVHGFRRRSRWMVSKARTRKCDASLGASECCDVCSPLGRDEECMNEQVFFFLPSQLFFVAWRAARACSFGFLRRAASAAPRPRCM